VQVDPAPVLKALESHLPTDSMGAIATRMAANQPLPRSPIPFPSTDQPSRRLHSFAALLAAIVVGFLAFEWLGPKVSSPPGPVAPPQAAAVAPPGAPDAAAAGEPAGLPSDAPAAPADGDAAKPAASPAGPAPSGAPEGATAASPQAGAAAGAMSAAERTVRLAFDRESWVEIRDARGKLIFSQLNPPGSSQVVQGEAPLSLVVGNAHSVRVAYQDREIDLAPFTRVDVARLTLE
jgi:cytoskeleton protein RodZ